MKTVIPKADKRKLILKQVPLSNAEMRRLEKRGKPVDPAIFMAKPKEAVKQSA